MTDDAEVKEVEQETICGYDAELVYEARRLGSYEGLITDEDLISDDSGNKFIPLAVLERLARVKGIREQRPSIVGVPTITNLMAVVEYTIFWVDGTISAGCGDAHPENVDGNFANYVTAIAETRAKARALRSGLGISVCSQEETATTKTREDLLAFNNASAAQVVLINKLLQENEMTFYGVKEQFEDIFTGIDDPVDLNQRDALKMIAWLQSKAKRKVAKKNK